VNNEMKGILAILMAGIMMAAMIAPAMSTDTSAPDDMIGDVQLALPSGGE
jgi:hypothetical protein